MCATSCSIVIFLLNFQYFAADLGKRCAALFCPGGGSFPDRFSACVRVQLLITLSAVWCLSLSLNACTSANFLDLTHFHCRFPSFLSLQPFRSLARNLISLAASLIDHTLAATQITRRLDSSVVRRLRALLPCGLNYLPISRFLEACRPCLPS